MGQFRRRGLNWCEVGLAPCVIVRELNKCELLAGIVHTSWGEGPWEVRGERWEVRGRRVCVFALWRPRLRRVCQNQRRIFIRRAGLVTAALCLLVIQSDWPHYSIFNGVKYEKRYVKVAYYLNDYCNGLLIWELSTTVQYYSTIGRALFTNPKIKLFTCDTLKITHGLCLWPLPAIGGLLDTLERTTTCNFTRRCHGKVVGPWKEVNHVSDGVLWHYLVTSILMYVTIIGTSPSVTSFSMHVVLVCVTWCEIRSSILVSLILINRCYLKLFQRTASIFKLTFLPHSSPLTHTALLQWLFAILWKSGVAYLLLGHIAMQRSSRWLNKSSATFCPFGHFLHSTSSGCALIEKSSHLSRC